MHGCWQEVLPALSQHIDLLAWSYTAGEECPAAEGPRLRLVVLGGHEEEVGSCQQQPGPGLPCLNYIEELVRAVLPVEEGKKVAVEQPALRVGNQHPVPRAQVLHQLGAALLQVHRGRAREAATGFGRHRVFCFDGAVDVRLRLVVDPVEAGLDGQAGQHAVLAAVPVRGGDVHGAALIVQGLLGVVAVLVPAFCYPQLHPGPLIHHRDSQGVQLVLAALASLSLPRIQPMAGVGGREERKGGTFSKLLLSPAKLRT